MSIEIAHQAEGRIHAVKTADKRKERSGNAEFGLSNRTHVLVVLRHLCSVSLRVLRAFAFVWIAILVAAQGLDAEDHRAAQEGLSEDEYALFCPLQKENITRTGS